MITNFNTINLSPPNQGVFAINLYLFKAWDMPRLVTYFNKGDRDEYETFGFEY